MASMNPNLILAASQGIDVMGAAARGNALARDQMDMQKQNALAGYYRTNADGLLAGDQNALAGLMVHDPAAALGIQRQRQEDAWRQDDRKYRRDRDARQDERADQEWSMKVQQYAAGLSAAERQAHAQQIEDAVKMGLALPDEATWDATMAQEAPELVGKFGMRDALAQRYMSVAEIMKGQRGSEFRMATPEQAAAYGAQGGQFGPDGRFYPINPPSGMTIESDGQGGFRMVQGAGAVRPLTESQSKDAVYATRAEGALTALEAAGPEALTDRTAVMADRTPLGIGRGIQSDQYQVARNAGDEFLQAILRKDTGAAITSQEMAEYGRTYLPQPGDGAAVLRQKSQARVRALEALKAGMPPAAILAQERALEASGQPAAQQPAAQSAPDGIDPEIWDVMTEDERALFQ